MDKKHMITVFTPAYNRAYILHKCYESLCSQTNDDFVWIIVDDGSTDNTRELVKGWIDEGKIDINYIYQKNQGKHAAHNTGVLNADTEVFVCVDSDDYLTVDAVDRVISLWPELKDDQSLSGILALRGKPDGKTPIGTRMPDNVSKASLMELLNRYKFKGDAVIFYKTSILKENLFPVFEGERFVTEATVWDVIDQQYDLMLCDEILYICEYLEDGLSFVIYKHIKNSPNGYIYFMKQRIQFSKRFKDKCVSYARFYTWCIIFKRFEEIRQSKNKIYILVTLPIVILWYIKIRVKMNGLKVK